MQFPKYGPIKSEAVSGIFIDSNQVGTLEISFTFMETIKSVLFKKNSSKEAQETRLIKRDQIY